MAPRDRVDGVALAALLLEDRSLEAAAPGLAHELAEGARDRLREMGGRDAVDGLRTLARSLRPAPADGCALPPRARALIADRAPRPVGRRWVAEAPPPRHGFQPDPGLRDWLRRAATVSRVDDGGGR